MILRTQSGKNIPYIVENGTNHSICGQCKIQTVVYTDQNLG